MPWYKVTELVRVVQALRGINFSIVEQRQQGLQRLAALTSECPYSEFRRFPDSAYVCEAHGDWARKFQQVRVALSTKEHNKDDRVREGVGSAPATASNDSLVAYHNALTSMYDQIIRMDGVFTRTTFEDHYNLQWQ